MRGEKFMQKLYMILSLSSHIGSEDSDEISKLETKMD